MRVSDGLRVILSVSVLLTLPACASSSRAGGEDQQAPEVSEAPVEIELASLMGEMQRHSAKLGFAIAGGNRPLATFYLHEIDEVLEELMTVEEHDGMPIAKPSRVILLPEVEALAVGLSGEVAWPELTEGYHKVIDACNRCHLATEHGFIEILPAAGEPPFNQRFEAMPGS